MRMLLYKLYVNGRDILLSSYYQSFFFIWTNQFYHIWHNLFIGIWTTKKDYELDWSTLLKLKIFLVKSLYKIQGLNSAFKQFVVNMNVFGLEANCVSLTLFNSYAYVFEVIYIYIGITFEVLFFPRNLNFYKQCHIFSTNNNPLKSRMDILKSMLGDVQVRRFALKYCTEPIINLSIQVTMVESLLYFSLAQ
jgi:hypothetical protein